MTITPRVLHGAYRAPSAPALRMPSRRPGAAPSRATVPSGPIVADCQPASYPVPAIAFS